MHRYTRVVRAIHRRAYLASLEEYQERDSEWALSRILNLIVKVNEHNPMCMGCYFDVTENSDKTSSDQRAFDGQCVFRVADDRRFN